MRPPARSPFSANPSPPAVIVSGEGDRLALAGELDIATLAGARQALKKWSKPGTSRSLDVAGLDRLDTPGALFLCGLVDKGVSSPAFAPSTGRCSISSAGSTSSRCRRWIPFPGGANSSSSSGKGAHDARHEAHDVITFVGRAGSWTVASLLHPHTLRPAAISRHIAETGIHALPIIGLMAVMIAIVIGYQGVAQLRPYGGEDFTINLVAVSVLREMGVLITAIMVAGRSGAAFTAEIGVMQTREEVDALKVMGIEPMQVLVVPRVIALVITLPLLTFFADIMGLVGGAAISQFLLDVSPTQYLTRLPQVVDGSDLFVGLFKAPVFAFFIAVVGCMHGLRVTRLGGERRPGDHPRGREGDLPGPRARRLFSILFERLGI